MGQIFLGYAYGTGNGVPRDDNEAVTWFRKAADQSNAEAQGNLGVMYQYSGNGVPKDYLQAYMWLSPAASQGTLSGVARSRDNVAAQMTQAQIEQARTLAAAWKPTTQ